VDKFYELLGTPSEDDNGVQHFVALMLRKSIESTKVARELEWIDDDEEWYVTCFSVCVCVFVFVFADSSKARIHTSYMSHIPTHIHTYIHTYIQGSHKQI
jgi:hypothetical protein